MTAVATRQYELVYICSPDAGEQEVADLHEQVAGVVSRFGGTIEKTENWGRRKLAYEIDRHREGTYVLELLNGPGDMIRELDRRLRVFDKVIRHLFVRVDEELRVAEATRARRVETAERRRAARGLSPQAAAGAAGESGAEATAGKAAEGPAETEEQSR